MAKKTKIRVKVLDYKTCKHCEATYIVPLETRRCPDCGQKGFKVKRIRKVEVER